MSFRHDTLVGIGIFYLPIKFQMLNRRRVVIWLTVIQQSILELNIYTGHEYIVMIFKHESTNFVTPVLFKMHTKKLSTVGNSKIF